MAAAGVLTATMIVFPAVVLLLKDAGTLLVICDDTGETTRLSERECDLLTVLARRPKQVFPREELLQLAFPDAESPTVVDTYIHYVRRKLGRSVIATVHGLGYQLGAE